MKRDLDSGLRHLFPNANINDVKIALNNFEDKELVFESLKIYGPPGDFIEEIEQILSRSIKNDSWYRMRDAIDKLKIDRDQKLGQLYDKISDN
jgi:hypothetical protein